MESCEHTNHYIALRSATPSRDTARKYAIIRTTKKRNPVHELLKKVAQNGSIAVIRAD